MAFDAAGRTTPLFSAPDSADISPGEVTAALDLVLASDAFARVERPSRFLRHLVEGTLRGEQDRLKETLLGVEIFGRDASWNTRLDPMVRQEAARLRKRLAKYYETASPDVRIELPVGTYVPVFHRVTGQAMDVEMVPPDASAEAAPAVAARPWRYRWVALAAALLLAGGSAGAWRFFNTRLAGGPPSIVVLPFTNLSTDPAYEYLAAGFAGEIADELVRLNSLRVIARSSARVFKSGSADVRDVGRQLNVSYVLEGSVERSGDEIRISARLERASDGLRVWYQTYDRPSKDLLTVQSELAGAVVRSLQVNSGREGAPRHIPTEEAHELYMRGYFELDKTTPESIGRAEKDFRRAVEIDPEYALAWNGLGSAKLNLSAASGRTRSPAELAEAKALYKKALDFDPDLSVAHANLGSIAMSSDWDWKAAERELQLSSRNGPNVTAECNLGLLFAFHGQFREADRHMEVARSLDPVGSFVANYRIALRYWEGRFPEAIALAQQRIERYPDQISPQLMLILAYSQGGQPDLALASARALATRFPDIRLNEAIALGGAGHREECLRLVHQFEIEYEGGAPVSPQGLALVWASLGDHAQTLKWLERSADLREFQILNLAVNPAFAKMRNDPGFRALRKRIGLN